MKVKSELIIQNVLKHIALRQEEQDHFLAMLIEKEVERNGYLQQGGERCDYIHFVNEGILRAFYISPDGKDSTVMFATRDWWITDMGSFLKEEPAIVNLQAVSKVAILSLSKSRLDTLFEELPVFNKFFRILMQNAYCREQRRSLQTLSLTPKDRYHRFLDKYPEIAQNVTQKQIASYLGITPEFLSYLRAQKD